MIRLFRILKDSTVTYTAVSSPFEDGSDIGSPGVDGPPIMPEDPYAYIMAAYQVPPSPDYIPGPEVPPSPNYIPGPEEPQSPPPLDFVPKPMYPEYIPQEDEILPAEEQPLPAAASPTADSPGYVPESDPEEDDEDPEEDPADYPADRDDDDEDEDEEEEEEHPALVDSVPPIHRMTARISIRDEPSISLPPREEVERLLALTTPPPSPLTPLSSPLPHIPSPPFPASPPASPIRPLGYRAAMIRLRAETPSTSHPLPLPTSSPLLYKIGESSAVAATRPVGGRRADYGFVDPKEAVEEVAPMTLGGVNTRVIELTAVQEQDTQDIYAVIEDTQDRQTQIYQSVGTLVDDSQSTSETARLLDQRLWFPEEVMVGGTLHRGYAIRTLKCEIKRRFHRSLALRSSSDGQQAVDFIVADNIDSKPLSSSLNSWTRRSSLGLNSQADNKDKADDTAGTTRIINQTRDKTLKSLAAEMVTDTIRRPDLCVSKVTITMKGLISKRECLKLKNNNNRDNRVGNAKAQAKVYAVGNAGANPNINIITDEDKSKEKRLEDVPVVQEFLEVFPEDLPGASGATTGTYGQRLHKTKFLTLRSSGSVCKEERWVFSDVHRLQGIEQTDCEEPLPTPKDR
ncbi:hypothetical protein Tco_1210241 [Tanacetum coccineum]